jgi:hypothetical protein
MLAALILTGVFALTLRAQQTEEQKGIDQGNYNIKQAIEFGYRFTDIPATCKLTIRWSICRMARDS